MTTPFSSALRISSDIAAHQQLPTSALYVIASPIGNLADITLRALHVLQKVDYIACEDTRHTLSLLQSFGLEFPRQRLLSLHQHNETQAAASMLEHLSKGLRLAYLSDAGTPGVSDPGAKLVSVVRAAGFSVIPIPGASSITTLLSVSGAFDAHHTGFVFVGFLSTKTQERNAQVQAMAQEPRIQILLEAPHRILECAQALQILDERHITVGRELTKQFEQIVTLKACDLMAWLKADPMHQKGEFALTLHAKEKTLAEETLDTRVLELLLEELPLKTAVDLSAQITSQPRKALYAKALSLKTQDH
jgi:16S rRNA (cytidine1402-2'-O)-methyltransferase